MATTSDKKTKKTTTKKATTSGNKKNSKFDLDLKYGQIQEQKVADMLQDCKIEVKTERGQWHKTGNIAIEYSCWSKPSGINVTKADYWFHRLNFGNENYMTLVFEVDKLKEIVKNCKGKKSIQGGDHKAARMWLIPLEKLVSKELIQKIKEGE